MPIKNALMTLLNALDKIAEQHREVYDTAVREEMAMAVHRAFIVPVQDFELDTNFAMFSDEGNQHVRTALEQFLQHPEVTAAKVQISTPEERLAAFQDDSVETSEGTTYEDYFGYADEPFDE